MTGNVVLHQAVRPVRADPPTPVLLHGSGQPETSLVGSALAVSADHPIVAARSRIARENGHMHFRRHHDQSFDDEDLAASAAAVCDLFRSFR